MLKTHNDDSLQPSFFYQNSLKTYTTESEILAQTEHVSTLCLHTADDT